MSLIRPSVGWPSAIARTKPGEWFVVRTKSRHEKILARELNNAGISAYLLLKRENRQYAQRSIDGVLSDTHRLGEILDDLLAAADTRRSVAHDEVDVGVVVAEAVESAVATAQELGKELTVTGQDEVVVRGSESSLRRAVIALVDNALDHASTAVSVDVRADHGSCRVAVSDDGPGIDAEVLPRMFQRFASAREPASPRRHYGLGLALVADVATAHGGKVSAAPRGEGQGAVLTLTLPLA